MTERLNSAELQTYKKELSIISHQRQDDKITVRYHSRTVIITVTDSTKSYEFRAPGHGKV